MKKMPLTHFIMIFQKFKWPNTLTTGSQHRTVAHCAFAPILWPLYIPTIVVF